MKYLALTLLLTGLSLQSLLAWGGPGPWANGAYYPGQLDGSYSANVYNNTQARGDYNEMDTPSGNIVRTDTFETTFKTNVTSSSATVISNTGGLTSTSSVTTLTTNVVAHTTKTDSSAAGVVSGVVGFGVNGGSPSVSSNGTTTTTVGSSAGINVDSSENYFVIYVDGMCYAGQTAAGINLHTQRVAGSLLQGSGGDFNAVLPQETTSPNGNKTVTYQTVTVPASAANGYFNAKIKSDQSPFIFKGAGEISIVENLVNLDTAGETATYPFNLDGIKVSDN
jgi:hypothetical protein